MRHTEEQIDDLLDKLENILAEFDIAEDKYDRDQWTKKYGDKLEKYSDKLKVLNGDDFDLMKESYDEYHKEYSDISDDEYIESLEQNIVEVLDKVGAAFGGEVAEKAEDLKEGIQENLDEKKEGGAAEEAPETETHIETKDTDGDGVADTVETHELEKVDETEEPIAEGAEESIEDQIDEEEAAKSEEEPSVEEPAAEEEQEEVLDEIEQFIQELKNSPEYRHEHPEEFEDEKEEEKKED